MGIDKGVWRMSIEKIDSLNYELTCLGDNRNLYMDMEFDENGLTIDYSKMSWDDIKAAYKEIFKKEIEDE